jgi:hypothetical protein
LILICRRPRFASLTALLALALAAVAAGSQEGGWRLEKDKDGIQVYTRAVDGWTVREFKGVSSIAADLSSLVAIITDAHASREFSEFVSETEIRHRESDTHYQVYSATKLPWPLSDRDILSQRDITQNKNSFVVTITDVAIEDPEPPRKGFVRIVKSRTEWKLSPTSRGMVLVETSTLSDPGAPIPSSIINAMSVSTPFKTLTKLKELAGRPEYAHVQLPFIEEPH